MRYFTLVFVILFCLQPLTAAAELYQWTDENGVVHFSNTQPDPAADVQVMEEKDTVDDSRLKERREQQRRSFERQRRQNQTRDALEERQEEVDQHNLSVYERRRDYHRQRADSYKALVKNKKHDLDRAEERYNEVKRESFSDSSRHRKKLNRYESRVENTETTIETYSGKVEYHEGQAENYQDQIDQLR
ncbi:MAG: DUF4124 domain-containing protein [Desulfobacterales bacterium]